MKLNSPQPKPAQSTTRTTPCPTSVWSPSLLAFVCNAPSFSLSQSLTVRAASLSMLSHMLQFKPLMLMSERIFARTSSSLVVLPCTKASLTVSSRKSPNSLPPVLRFVLSHPLTVNSLSGRVPQLSLPLAPSQPHGLPPRTTKNTVPPLFTESVAELNLIGLSVREL